MKYGITTQKLSCGSGIDFFQIQKGTIVEVEQISDKYLPGANITIGDMTIQLPESWPIFVKMLDGEELRIARLLWE